MKKPESNISKKISEELVNPSLDLGIDYAEIGVDKLADGAIFEEVPIVKTILSAVRTGVAIKDYFFCKKLLIFLREFHLNTISKEKLAGFQYKFSSNQKFKEKTIEYILVLNERFLELDKSKILANLFASHIEGEIDWEYFRQLSACLDRIFPGTISILHKLYEMNFKMERNHELDTIETLTLLSSAGLGIQEAGPPFTISKMAKDLYEFGKIKSII
jgi:hypothetical protein